MLSELCLIATASGVVGPHESGDVGGNVINNS